MKSLLLTALSLFTFAQAQPCEDGFRNVTHAAGETCVPETPQRVVVLDTGELDGALSLGVKPVGAVEALPGLGFPDYLSEMTEGIERVGTISEPNLEAILGLQPDLILSSNLRHETIYDQLSEIAPTVFTETVGVVWKDNLEVYAEALGRQETLDLRMGEYQAQLEAVRRSADTSQEVSIIRFVPGQNRVMQKGSFIGTVIEDVGFARPESQRSSEFMVTVSQEEIDLMDGDVIFMSVFGDADDTALDAFTSSPLWQSLSAVQADEVYRVSDDHWFLGIGLIGAERVLDDLLIYLADTEANVTSPKRLKEHEMKRLAILTLLSFALFAHAQTCVSHELGETCFETPPERIVVLEYSFADHLGTLGVAPVGYAVDAMPEYLTPYTEGAGAEPVGTRKEPSLEAITALDPDLIIADLNRHEEIYNELSAVAPTLVFNSLRGSYEDQLAQFQEVARILDKEAEADAVLEDYTARFESVQAQTEGDLGAFVSGVLWSGGFTAHSDESFIGSFLERLGRDNALDVRGGETQYLLDLEGFSQRGPEQPHRSVQRRRANPPRRLASQSTLERI